MSKADYKYTVASGVDASHLFSIKTFPRLTDALEQAEKLNSAGKAFRVERLADGYIITDSKQYAKHLADEKRRAYCDKKGYKFIP
jgi:hypothetical protein